MDRGTTEVLAELERRRQEAIRRTFTRIDPLAFAVACGTTAALVIALVTGRLLVSRTEDALEYSVGLLGQFLRGFDISWIGLAWGVAWFFGLGFVGGFVIAYCRNLALHVVLAKLNWDQARWRRRHFLDEI